MGHQHCTRSNNTIWLSIFFSTWVMAVVPEEGVVPQMPASSLTDLELSQPLLPEHLPAPPATLFDVEESLNKALQTWMPDTETARRRMLLIPSPSRTSATQSISHIEWTHPGESLLKSRPQRHMQIKGLTTFSDQTTQTVYYRVECIREEKVWKSLLDIHRGSLLRKEDFRQEWSILLTPMESSDSIQKWDDSLNVVAKRFIPRDQALGWRMVTKPLAIKQGQMFSAAIEQSGIVVQTKIKAMENGSIGDVIRAMITTNKQIVEARITGPEKGEVLW
jgi:flagella basal body P-ring formation protein FlgA